MGRGSAGRDCTRGVQQDVAVSGNVSVEGGRMTREEVKAMTDDELQIKLTMAS